MRAKAWCHLVATGCGLALVAAPPATAQRVGAYVVRQGATVVAAEAYGFDGVRLLSTLTIPAQRLVIDGTTEYDTTLSPTRYTASARWLGDSVPFSTLEVVFGDSAVWHVGGAAPQDGATPLQRPYGVLRNLAYAHLAVLLGRYDRVSGGPQVFTLWLPEGPVTLPVRLEVVGDSGQAVVQGLTFHLTLSDGWLQEVRIPAQRVVVESADPATLPQLVGDSVPRPSAPPTVLESAFTVLHGPVPLDGTLTVPATRPGRLPVALIVAGSGPTDRDGNSPAGVSTDMYAQLAWRLGERGIATVRYDKRGLGRSRATIVPAATTFDDFAGDVAALADSLSRDGRFDAVVVVGHSEGAGLAVRAAHAGAPMAGMALVAGIGRPFLVVLREQLAEQLDAATMASFDSLMARYLAGDTLGVVPAVLRPLLAPVNREFTRTSAAYDPATEFARVAVPSIVVQGTADVQVSQEDARLLHAANPASRLVLIPGMTHVFKYAAVRGRSAQVAQYGNRSLPIMPELVDTLAAWIAEVLGR